MNATPARDPFEFDLGDDLHITKTDPPPLGRRRLGFAARSHGHRFDALVFPEHAEVAEYELGDSRISKLWVQRLADKKTVFNWDRGMDQPAADQITQAIVDFLAAGLADQTYAS